MVVVVVVVVNSINNNFHLTTILIAEDIDKNIDYFVLMGYDISVPISIGSAGRMLFSTPINSMNNNLLDMLSRCLRLG